MLLSPVIRSRPLGILHLSTTHSHKPLGNSNYMLGSDSPQAGFLHRCLNSTNTYSTTRSQLALGSHGSGGVVSVVRPLDCLVLVLSQVEAAPRVTKVRATYIAKPTLLQLIRFLAHDGR